MTLTEICLSLSAVVRVSLESTAPLRYREHHLFEHGSAQGIRLKVDIDGTTHILVGEGNGPINAAVHALQSAGISVQVRSYEERSMAPVGERAKLIIAPDWDAINASRDDWTKRWNREVER